MTNTISAVGITNIVPALVLSYDTESESGNIIHPVLNAEDPAITFGVEGMRAGVLEMYFATSALAWAARASLKLPKIFTLVSTDESAIGMKFVRSGRMRIGLDSSTLKSWVLTVGYQEVP